jgi:hypothetical protein
MIETWDDLITDLQSSVGISMCVSEGLFNETLDKDGNCKDDQESKDLFSYGENIAVNAGIQKVALIFLDNMHTLGIANDMDDDELHEAVYYDQNFENDQMMEINIEPFIVKDGAYEILYTMNRFYNHIQSNVTEKSIFPQEKMPSFKNLAYLMKYAYETYDDDALYLFEHAAMYSIAFDAESVKNNENASSGLKKTYAVINDTIVSDFFTNNDFGEVEPYIGFGDSPLHGKVRKQLRSLYSPLEEGPLAVSNINITHLPRN